MIIARPCPASVRANARTVPYLCIDIQFRRPLRNYPSTGTDLILSTASRGRQEASCQFRGHLACCAADRFGFLSSGRGRNGGRLDVPSLCRANEVAMKQWWGRQSRPTTYFLNRPCGAGASAPARRRAEARRQSGSFGPTGLRKLGTKSMRYWAVSPVLPALAWRSAGPLI
jgi:hypothetical protein